MDQRSELSPVEDAATVVLLRDGATGLEVLLLQRPERGGAFANMWAFPGGKVDPEDRLDPTGIARPAVAAARQTAVRELAEETGQRLDPGQLIPLAHWTPRQRVQRRFATWFFVAPAESSAVLLNPAEHRAARWFHPGAALAEHAADALPLAPPTWVTLARLADYPTATAALQDSAARRPLIFASQELPPAADGRSPGVMWAGDASYDDREQLPSGQRHRLLTAARPWRYEVSASLATLELHPHA